MSRTTSFEMLATVKSEFAMMCLFLKPKPDTPELGVTHSAGLLTDALPFTGASAREYCFGATRSDNTA
jgi:hypothetical protein